MPAILTTPALAINPIKPVASKTAAFINNMTTGNTVDPGIQSRTVIDDNGPTLNAQQAAYKSKLSQIGDSSRRFTDIIKSGIERQRAQQQPQVSVGERSQQGSYEPNQQSMEYARNYKPATNSAARQQVIQTAMQSLGTPYSYGGGSATQRVSRGINQGANTIGVDCSGLTSYAYAKLGVKLPRTANGQTTYGVRTSIANAQPGDLVGWAKGGHVAIYIGNGQIIESPHTGAVVRIRNLGKNERTYAVRLTLPGE